MGNTNKMKGFQNSHKLWMILTNVCFH